jgi:hypothetical protein
MKSGHGLEIYIKRRADPAGRAGSKLDQTKKRMLADLVR